MKTMFLLLIFGVRSLGPQTNFQL